jgi:hypothetical protein
MTYFPTFSGVRCCRVALRDDIRPLEAFTMVCVVAVRRKS